MAVAMKDSEYYAESGSCFFLRYKSQSVEDLATPRPVLHAAVWTKFDTCLAAILLASQTSYARARRDAPGLRKADSQIFL